MTVHASSAVHSGQNLPLVRLSTHSFFVGLNGIKSLILWRLFALVVASLSLPTIHTYIVKERPDVGGDEQHVGERFHVNEVTPHQRSRGAAEGLRVTRARAGGPITDTRGAYEGLIV